MAVFVAGARMSRHHHEWSARRRPSSCSAMVVALRVERPKKPPTGTPEPDKFLFERGTEELDKRRWLVVPRILPPAGRQLSRRANIARMPSWASAIPIIGEGSAESYVLAINEFREFLSFYPDPQARRLRAAEAWHGALLPDARARARPDRDARGDPRNCRRSSALSQLGTIDEGQKYLREAKDRLGDSEYPRRRLLLPLEVVSRRDRSAEDVPQERSGIHQSRRRLLLSRRVV